MDKIFPTSILFAYLLFQLLSVTLRKIGGDGPLAGVTEGWVAHVVRQAGRRDDRAQFG